MPPNASLADRHDGLMLGCFLSAAASPAAAPRFEYLRSRINDHLMICGSSLVLPTEQDWLIAKQDDVIKIIWDDTQNRSAEMADFFFIGAAAYNSVVEGVRVPDDVAGLRGDLISRLERLHLPAHLAHDFWARALYPSDNLRFDKLISALLRLVRRCIEPIRDSGVAFVAMPFSEPFALRYREFYVPLLSRMGYQAVRAWGGVAFEDYWDLLLALISKSRVLFADLTGVNANVLHEVGLAEGMEKTALLVVEHSDAELPSNLGYHAIVSYDPREADWPGRAIDRTAAVLLRGLKASGSTVGSKTNDEG